ncbi:transporter substrate-binding domain-containing protein [Shinella sp.]|uniref:transporter substrate-binding domain-containing protein n=1 Tax=Shinella sp. TaxID=1870904 RepID=UPI003F6FDE1E
MLPVKMAMLAMLLVLSIVVAKAEPLKVGIAAEPYPPFILRDSSGNWVGWEIEIIDALCAEAKLQCTITPTVWDAMIPSLTTGKIDLIAAMFITEERRKIIDFSDRYYKTPTVIVGTRGTKMGASPMDLQGRTLGVQVATVHEVYARKHFASTVDQIRVYQTQDDAEQDLVAGRIDALQADAVVVEKFLASAAGKTCCELKGRVADDEDVLGLGAGMGLRKGNAPLREKLNAAIKSIRENGRYREISKKHFAFDIYGN